MPGFSGPAQSTLPNAGPQQQAQGIAALFGNNSKSSAQPQASLSSLFSGTGTSLKYVVYWGVAALALIALAKPYPDLATGFTVLLIVGVVLTHANDYIGLFSPPKH